MDQPAEESGASHDREAEAVAAEAVAAETVARPRGTAGTRAAAAELPSSSAIGPWRLFAIWAGIGLQSFGGGASTTLLIQRTFIERRGWLTLDEFTRLWNLCLLTPGINLIAVTVLIGKRLGGVRGIVASAAGLLVPSATITCLLAALFVQVAHLAAVQAIVRGVVPATAGIMGMVMLNFARPLAQRRRTARPAFRWGAGPLAAAVALTIIAGNVSAVLVVLAAVLVGILFFSPHRPAQSHAEGTSERTGNIS